MSTTESGIRVEHLTKRRGDHLVLDDVSLQARAGEVTCLVGPNGSGKSTVLKCLAGIVHADEGRALIEGRPVAEAVDAPSIVGFHLDPAASYAGRTGDEELALACLAAGQPRSRRSEVADDVGLTRRALRKRVRTYSLGMRQRLGIGVALVARPRVIVLDEPFGGLDREGIDWMRRSMRRWADAGGTVLITNHYFAEMADAVDRLYVLGPSGAGVSTISMTEIRSLSRAPGASTTTHTDVVATIERWYADATRR